MPRTRSTPVDTREALVDAAWALLAERGWEGTSVNAVIERAGVSKGTFYHRFASAEELLDAVAERMFERSLSAARPHIQSDAPALEQLQAFLAAGRTFRFAHGRAWLATASAVMRPENRALRGRVEARTDAVIAPMLAAVLTRGADEGVFEVDDSELTAYLLISTSRLVAERQVLDLLGPDDPVVCAERVAARARAWLRLVERSIGAPRDSLSELDPGFEERVAKLKATAGERDEP